MNDKEIKAIEYINKILEYPKLYAYTGRESDFLRGIDKKQIETVLNLIEKQKAEIEKKDKIIHMLIDEREHIKNNLEVDLNKKGIFSQAKGQISQILEYYESNDKYFENKVKESK